MTKINKCLYISETVSYIIENTTGHDDMTS